ncbi:hypothetical protein NQ176_g10004 [Zarea fungicola]|uniref:Uncharacterized protein n=1 Tax=Zarea fungicola TaxID=93591 RepID=A0ACC1MJC6_9HYPO|nr:hypothetical protein NQ176_g10004 [Lecanicillium fungicola]
MSDDYSLRGESTASLAKLSQNLSEENETVLALMSDVMEQLREMSGWEEGRAETTQGHQQQSFEEMSSELESIMEHMQFILNNPSFVPIEEVMVREEEINRLKDGWVKMETRWKDAMLLIDGWRKRMAAGGSPIREDELKLGFRLGSVRLTGTSNTIGDSTLAPLLEENLREKEDSATYGDDNAYDESENESESYEDQEDRNEVEAEVEMEAYDEGNEDEAACEVPEEQHAESEETKTEEVSRESTPLPEPPRLSPLRKSSSAGNRGSRQQPQPTNARQRKQPEATSSNALPAPSQRSSSTIHMQKRGLEQPSRRPSSIASRVFEPKANVRPPTRVTSLEKALVSEPVPTHDSKPAQPVEKQPMEKPEVTTKSQLESDRDIQSERKLHKVTETAATKRPSGRPTPHQPFPRPAEPASQQSPLTMSNIAAKLAASEADAARVRAKLQAARSRSSTIKPTESLTQSASAPVEDGVGTAAAHDQIQEPEVVDEISNPAHDMANIEQAEVDADQPPSKDEGQLKVQKRKRDIRISSKRTSRRRSTLSPMELETLISGVER